MNTPTPRVVTIPPEHPDEVAKRDLGPKHARHGRVGDKNRPSIWRALTDYQASVDEPPAGEGW